MPKLAIALLSAYLGFSSFVSAETRRPNIVWIVAEDASPHLGCFGETTIKTPQLDRLGQLGIRFDRAFVTCPVCSPSRSAMVTGVYQTTLGSHNHRSQSSAGKGRGAPFNIGVESLWLLVALLAFCLSSISLPCRTALLMCCLQSRVIELQAVHHLIVIVSGGFLLRAAKGSGVGALQIDPTRGTPRPVSSSTTRITQ